MVYGARQVGKTWLMQEFGRTEFKNVLYLNFDKNEKARRIFGENIDPFNIISLLENDFEIKIDPKNTLLIFDEIQESQRAKDSLKYFNEEAPEYHIIAAGSFLGVATGKFPVGQVNRLTIYPMSFYEFLEAIGRNQLLGTLRKLNPRMITGLSGTASELLKSYFYVGGMPEAVQTYAKTRDMRKVREIQDFILDNYKGDFSKHIKGVDIPKVRMLWDSIPTHLAKEKKKFIYKEIKSGGRAAEFENAMDWLVNTGLVYKVMRTETAKIPLLSYQQRDIFKLFMLDIGLLCAHSKIDMKTFLQPDANIFDDFKGALTEQFVLQELKNLTTNPILYWVNEKGHSEIDFVLQYNGEIIPIEAKSSENARAKSLKVYMDMEKPAHAVRTSLKNYGVRDNLYSVPLYMMGSFLDIIF
jgi:predicted AAA+ superfamily ATPase